MNGDCIFCKIASGKVPAKVVYQDEQVVAFSDVSPQAPVHILVIPKAHVTEPSDLISTNCGGLLSSVFGAITKIVAEKKLKEKGYRVVLNSGKDAGQAVEHIHFHLLSGRVFSWPPG